MQAGDYAEAYCLWRPLAMRGHTEAAYHLGWLFANGNGLRVDVAKAVYWWGQAASHGHSDAMFALALAYTNGEGIKKDDDEAMRWYLKAAAKGNEDAREIVKSKVRVESKEVMPHLKSLMATDWLGWKTQVKADAANLRGGPGTQFKIIGKAEKGTRFLVVQHTGEWLQVIKPADYSYAWVADWLVDKRDGK